MTNETTLQEEIDTFASGKAPVIEANDMIPHIFANDKTNPALFGLIDMLYNGAFTNTMGVMVAKNKDTGKEETIIVGLVPQEQKEEGVVYGLYPIARFLSLEESSVYLTPDGEGGYLDDRKSE